MIFTSVIYVVFLAVVVVAYWLVPRQHRKWLLLAASYGFYAAWDWRFLGLIVASTLTDYFVARAMPDRDRIERKRLLWASIAVNVGILGVFKYFGFFVDNAAALLEVIGFQPNQVFLDVVLPVGISFYTFQTLAYTIDVYRRRIQPERDLVVFAVFVAFFPQLVAGPIERAEHLLPQLREPLARPSRERLREGLVLLGRGAFRKIVLADTAARMVDPIFANPSGFNSAEMALAVVGFGVQIYGDFAGYTDMARGSARLLGVDLVENFREPYLARSISDFWRRWHISLSRWLRDYLYIPLGGNRGTRHRTLINLMLTMVVGGLWHGAAWTFVIWGALHGAYLVIERITTDRSRLDRRADVGWIVLTQGLVFLAWIPFRAPDFTTASEIFVGIVAPDTFVPTSGMLAVTILGVAATSFGLDLLRRRPLARSTFRTGLAWGTATVGLVVFSGAEAAPFVYFQF